MIGWVIFCCIVWICDGVFILIFIVFWFIDVCVIVVIIFGWCKGEFVGVW